MCLLVVCTKMPGLPNGFKTMSTHRVGGKLVLQLWGQLAGSFLRCPFCLVPPELSVLKTHFFGCNVGPCQYFRQYLPLLCTCSMVKIELFSKYTCQVVANNSAHVLSNTLRVINHYAQFHCSNEKFTAWFLLALHHRSLTWLSGSSTSLLPSLLVLVSLLLVQTMGPSHNCLHELVMTMSLLKILFHSHYNTHQKTCRHITHKNITVLCNSPTQSHGSY